MLISSRCCPYITYGDDMPILMWDCNYIWEFYRTNSGDACLYTSPILQFSVGIRLICGVNQLLCMHEIFVHSIEASKYKMHVDMKLVDMCTLKLTSTVVRVHSSASTPVTG